MWTFHFSTPFLCPSEADSSLPQGENDAFRSSCPSLPKRHTPPTRLTNLQGSASKAHRACIHTRNHDAVPQFNDGVSLFNSAVLPFNVDVLRIFRQSTWFMKGKKKHPSEKSEVSNKLIINASS